MYTSRLMEEQETEILRTVGKEPGKSRVTEAWEGSFKKGITLSASTVKPKKKRTGNKGIVIELFNKIEHIFIMC